MSRYGATSLRSPSLTYDIIILITEDRENAKPLDRRHHRRRLVTYLISTPRSADRPVISTCNSACLFNECRSTCRPDFAIV